MNDVGCSGGDFVGSDITSMMLVVVEVVVWEVTLTSVLFLVVEVIPSVMSVVAEVVVRR